MKKPLAFRGMILPFITGFARLILNLVSLGMVNEVESLTLISNLYYAKVVFGVLFFIGIATMLVSIIYLGREKGLVQREMFASSRPLLKANFWKYALFTVIILILSLLQNSEGLPSSLTFIVGLIYVYFVLGLSNFTLLLVKKQKADYKDLIVGFKKFINYIIANLLTLILVFISVIFLVVPGIYIAFRLSMISYLILDQDLGPITAIKKSWAITKNKVSNIFAISIILGTLSILGMLALGVGLLWALPMFYLVTVTLYTKLLALEK